MIKFDYLCIKDFNLMVRTAIRTKMKESGIRASALCKSLGLQNSNFSAFVSGKRTLPYRDLVRVMVELQLSIGGANQPRAIFPATMMHDILREAIEHSTMSKKVIAEKTGVEASVLSAYLTGGRTMALRHIESLMALLNLKVLNAA